MNDDKSRERALLKLCRDLFKSNVIGTDFDDVQVFMVAGRDFEQQSDGNGIHISFSVSWQGIGKTGKDAHDALETFIPPDEDGSE